MLCEIRIENVAVIEKATAVFGDGLNVLTGETGAGKSILIDSINAILGNRASKDLVRTGEKKACIWATFENLPKSTLQQLQEAGYEAGDSLFLYREINAEGKSLCRINGMPATAAIVRELCADLITIHGQHDNQNLLNPAKHISILDAFAQNQTAHQTYYEAYRLVVRIKRERDALDIDETEKARKMETLRYHIEELEQAEITLEEEDALQTRKKLVLNAQKLAQELHVAHQAFTDSDDFSGIVSLLGDAANACMAIGGLSQELNALADTVADLYESARGAADDIGNQMEQYDFDPAELDQIEERLDIYYKLHQKYACDTPGLLAYLETARTELAHMENNTERLLLLNEELTNAYTAARALAQALTETRLQAFEQFNTQLTQALQFLNMPGIRFTLQHKTGALASSGQDSVEFYISANAGEAPKPLAKIASGGELSRIMLALKSALADKDEIGTVIYDEIDTGVSGLAAARIGEKLKQTAQGRQVICITHTAQIAALADVHLQIKKYIADNRTYTQIDTLDISARQKELARMISGDKITELALANAKEMLQLHNA